MNEGTTPEVITGHNPMLISLKFSFGKSTGTDEEITDRICNETGANREDLSARKRVFCKEATAPLRSMANEWKGRLRRFAPPWDMPSMFLCKPAAVSKALALRDEYQPQLTVLKAGHLIERYDHWKELTKSRLKGAYKDEEFPTVEDLNNDVTWSMGVLPLPETEAIRRMTELGGEDIIQAIAESHNARLQTGVRAGMAEGFVKLIAPIQKMVDVLVNPDKKIFESLVENVRGVIAEVPAMNLVDNPELTAFAKKSEELLASISVDMLRDDSVIRQSTADRAKAIIETFAMPGLRKFSLP